MTTLLGTLHVTYALSDTPGSEGDEISCLTFGIQWGTDHFNNNKCWAPGGKLSAEKGHVIQLFHYRKVSWKRRYQHCVVLFLNKIFNIVPYAIQ